MDSPHPHMLSSGALAAFRYRLILLANFFDQGFPVSRLGTEITAFAAPTTLQLFKSNIPYQHRR
jgi:hypothetical protein